MLQRTEEWRQTRLGKVTGSRIAELCAKTKSGWAASRANYMAELIAERLTGTDEEGFRSRPMQWGMDTEPQARAAYEFFTDQSVELAGFVPHPDIEMSGASPDGLVGADGLLEMKCPHTATHIETLMGASVPGRYVLQCQWQMACTGRRWCDFVSFDPVMPARMQFFCKRLLRDEIRIDIVQQLVRQFLAELEEKLNSLKALYS